MARRRPGGAMIARLGMLVEPFACPTGVATTCALAPTGNRSTPPKQSEERNIFHALQY
jgi:hypothetical protein